MLKMPFRAALSALIFVGFGAVVMAAPSFHSSMVKAVKAVQSAADGEALQHRWMTQSVIQAGLVQRGASIWGGDAYADFHGRKLEIKQAQINLGLSDTIELFYGSQFSFAKGLSATSRYEGRDDYYGARVVVKKPTASDHSALSLQAEAIRPGTADVKTSGTEATFAATHNLVGAVNYQDRRDNLFQLQYTDVTAPAGRFAHVLSATAGRDFLLGEFIKARVQASLIGEDFQALGESRTRDLKPMFFAALGANPTSWLSLELDLTVLTSGIPFAGGEYTGLSSFGIYQPGGLFDDLRRDPVAFGSARIMFHGKF